uniref:uncharacterized protein LOC120329775 n=1 Tax=Styela clava TaxID=7725 RepID=UPI0019394C72|nr:uncharacterized protein LOC120329775 [Styela clava]
MVKAAEKLGYGSYSAQETIKTDFSVARDATVKLIEAVPDSVSLSFTPALGATAHTIEVFRVGEEESSKIETEKDSLVIDKLELATKYGINITSKYGAETGKPTKDPIRILTVPAKPDYRDIHYVLDNGKPESKFLLAWKSQEHCEKHEVLIKCVCESGSREEQVLSSEGDKASLFCQALHKGCECSVYIRERNKSGFGEWSKEKIARSSFTSSQRMNKQAYRAAAPEAPDKARKLRLYHEDDILRAKWEASENASSYQVTLFEEGEKVKQVTCKSVETTFTNYVAQPGAFYTCEVTPFNIDGIAGKNTISEKCFIPLLPPSNVKYKFSDTEHDRVLILYEKSNGMKTALVVMSHPKEKDVTFNGENSCISPPLSDGRTYNFKIWAMNGNLQSPKHYAGTIVTRPKDVTISRPLVDPTTNLELEIHSDHREAFILKIKGRDLDEYEEIVQERKTILKNLLPATHYVIRASCVLKDVKTPEKSSPSVATLPGKVTGVKCEPDEKSQNKVLKWNKCKDDTVHYTIRLWKNDQLLEPVTTMKSEYAFKDLQPGSFTFRVSAGGGEESDPCHFVVTESPEVQVKIIEWNAVLIAWSRIEKATSYLCVLSSGTKSEEFKIENDTEIWVDKNSFQFKRSEKYTATIWALWNEHYSAPSRFNFITGLDVPTEIKSEWKWADPDRRTKPTGAVKFKWKPSPYSRMFAVKVTDFEGKIVDSAEVARPAWKCLNLRPGKEHRIHIRPGNVHKFFENSTSATFITAPPAPTKLETRVNILNKTSSINVIITSDYDGPFITKAYKDKKGKRGDVQSVHVGCSKTFTIQNLEPGQRYYFSSQSIYGTYESMPTFRVVS